MYYVGFSTATIVASIILFQGLNTDDPANSLSLLAGFITTFLGVHLLELARTASSPSDSRGAANGGYDAVGLETIYEPEPDDGFEDLANERTRLQHSPSPRSSRERVRDPERT